MARGIAWVITGAGLAAGLIYLLAGDVDTFGIATMVSVLALLSFLLYVGWSIRAWSEIPWALAWLIIVGIPVGGALAAFNERLLEVPLLVIALGWLLLAFQFTQDSTNFKSELKPV